MIDDDVKRKLDDRTLASNPSRRAALYDTLRSRNVDYDVRF
jgi:hypothetical protein